MKAIEKILFAVDFSENSDYAFDYALSFARSFNARLILLHVVNEPVDLRGFYVPHVSFERLEEEIRSGAEQMMETYCRTKLVDFDNYTSVVTTGMPYEEILKMADEEGVSLIVIGTHGRTGIDHLLFGSTAERVVRRAACPVMTVRLPAQAG